MSRTSKKKSAAQQIVGVAAMGLPAPVQKVVTSRSGAMLVVIVLPILVLSGIITVTWSGARPQVSVDRERAEQVQQRVAEKLGKVRDRWQDADAAGGGGFALGRGERPADGSFSPYWSGERVTPVVPAADAGILPGPSRFQASPPTAEANRTDGSFARLREKLPLTR